MLQWMKSLAKMTSDIVTDIFTLWYLKEDDI